MDILIPILVIWLIVTLIGHVSWVLLARFFRLFSADQKPFERPVAGHEADNKACDRVLDRLVSEKLIEPSQALELRQQIEKLEIRQRAVVADLLFPSAAAAPMRPVQRDESRPLSHAAESPPVPAQSVILATLCDEPPASASTTGQASPSVPAATPETRPSEPVLSKSEMIHSFLAAHNIRWGELVAGLLIVVCSIGLVISLWNTLIATHRVIPSLIFLAANASIFGAGLYTLSKWRVRHTSRAVLYIATLLVPLSVLAGLATAGTSVDAIQLNDPITLVAIGVAGAVYSLLLWLGGKALIGRRYAPALVLAVAGPSAVLPLMPAAVRTLGQNAGWFVGIGAIAIISALVWMVPAPRRKNMTIGVAGGRNRLLMMSVCGFTLVVSIAYAGFAVHRFGLDAMLPIAIASLPALIGIAGAGRWVMLLARSATQSLIGSASCVIAIGLTWVVLPASMKEMHWVWSWAVVLSSSGLAVGWLLKQPRWLAAATLPVGLAAILSSPIWLGDQVWQSVPLWRRFVGGEPMLAATIVASVAAAMMQAFRDRENRLWIGMSAASWAGFAMLNSGILALGPASWLGIAPSWSPTLILVLGVVASIIAASQRSVGLYAKYISSVTVALTALAWMSIYRPLVLSLPIAWSTPSTWMITSLSVAASLLLMAEVVPRFSNGRKISVGYFFPRNSPSGALQTRYPTLFSRTILSGLDRRTANRSSVIWVYAAVTASVLASVIACLSVRQDDWSRSAIYSSVATGLILWASTRFRSILIARIAQLVSISVAIVIGYGQFRGQLFGSDAWVSARAPWAWSVLAGSVTAFWFAVRELARLDSRPVRRRLGFLRRESAALGEMIDGPTAAAAVAMITLGAGWAFVALLSSAAGSKLFVNQSGFGLPLLAFALAAGLAFWMYARLVRTNRDWTPLLTRLIAVAAIVWVPTQLATLILTGATEQLILATSLAAIGCVAVGRFTMPPFGVPEQTHLRSLPGQVSAILVALASVVLLRFGWFEPIRNHLYASTLPTISVAAWWLIGAIALLADARRGQKASLAILSAVLAPAAIALLVPVYSTAHPLVWIQVAGIASLVWAGVTRWFAPEIVAVEPAARGSLWFVAITGLSTAVLVTARILFGLPGLHVIVGPAGALVSLFAVLLACFGRLPLIAGTEKGSGTNSARHPQGRSGYWLLTVFASETNSPRLPWPIGLSLLAGQSAWLSNRLGLASGTELVDVIAVIGCLAAFASLLRYGSNSMRLEFGHAALVSVGVGMLTIATGSFASTVLVAAGFASCVIGGLLVAQVGRASTARQPDLVVSRLLGWFIVLAGGYLLSKHVVDVSEENTFWMALVAWLATWVVAWRVVCPDRDGPTIGSWRALPDAELMILSLVAAVGETAVMIAAGPATALPSTWTDGCLWIRVASYVAIAISTSARGNRPAVWPAAIGIVMASVSIVSVRVAMDADATWFGRLAVATTSAGVALAIITHSLRTIAQTSTRLCEALGGTAPTKIGRLVRDMFVVSLAFAAIAVLVSIAMIAAQASAELTPIVIGAVALAALAVVELAELSRLSSMRHAAMSLILVSIGLWASVATADEMHPWLNGSMRWLVASVFMIPMTLLVMPRILGDAIAERWQEAFRRGATIATISAGSSLGIMLAVEALVRTSDGVAGLPLSLVLGVALTLGILSALAALIALLSGPQSSWRKSLEFSDTQRQVLIVAAQLVGAITWLHIFLCRPHWAFVGLREYWPYLVMGLSFLSVGVTEWAKRQRDQVLAKTLGQTALYLPMIPVIGFWLSGSRSEWAFAGGKIPYALLLAIGAAYYIGLSSLWKGVVPRIVAMVLGNGAIWVVLVQTPGWGFLSHPQVWLIPPAICVLVVAHLYRHRLEPVVSSGIRYASMLVIYVSSTADILLQQIGTSIAGPIVLILLALAGMGAGVVLRVRPFLYLGAAFVFVGVTSMVWHATESIDANWPWWVFGITTGISLLAGLMAIEKNKPKLRRFADSLASWDA